jgi:hypothetical protein
MKKIMILIASCSMLMACKKDRPELQPPASKMVGIQDDWQLSKVIQFDEITQRELDVSSVYIGTDPMKVNFKVTPTDTVYSVIAGSSANYLGTAGKWKFDNTEYPTKVIINYDGNEYNLPLLRTIREGDPTLEIKYTKVCRGRNVVSYKYIFTRI